MRAKDYFAQVAAAERDLQRLRATRSHYEDLGISITSDPSKVVVTSTRGGSRVEAAVIGMVDTDARIGDKIAQCQAILDKAERVISRIECDKFRQLLSLRYMAGWSFPAIADELGYRNRSSVYKAHGYALSEAQIVIDNFDRRNE